MAVKTRWDQKTYRRHMFDRGRGVRSPHEVTNTKMGTGEFIDSQLKNGGWWESVWRSAGAGELSAEKEYEQYNNPASMSWSPFKSDSAERKQFREQDRKEVRRLFAEAMGSHHFIKSKNLSRERLGNIVDAYMSQNEDAFQKTLRSMGVNDRDAARFTRAAQESADQAIEGRAYGTSWEDDDYARPAATTGVKKGDDKTGTTGQEQKGETSVQLANGKRVTSDTPLAPRPKPGSGASPAQPLSVGTTTEHGGTGLPTDSRVRVNGAPLDIRNTPANNSLAHLQNEQLKAAEIQAAENRRDAQSDAATSEVSRLQRRRAERLRQDKTRYALEQEAAQFREQQRADMMERRYKNRSFRNADDWANLGRLREGEKMLDQKDYDARVGDLVKRARKLRTAEGRAGLGSTDLQDMDMVFKTVGKLSTSKDADGNVSYGGNLTPAQIEALGKRISGFELRAKSNQAYAAAQAEAFNRRAADKYRQQYGLQGFSDEDVLGFHKARTAKTANDALDRMLNYGKGLSDSSEFKGGDPEALRRYEKDWDVIRGNVDTASIFNRAMEDKATKDKFMSDIADIGTGPGADIKQANLRRDTILRQMIKERTQGVTAPGDQTGAGPVTGAARATPTPTPQLGVSSPAEPAVAQPAQPAQPAAQVAAPGLPNPPASATPPVTPKKKPEDVQATMLAGVPLRPRARR